MEVLTHKRLTSGPNGYIRFGSEDTLINTTNINTDACSLKQETKKASKTCSVTWVNILLIIQLKNFAFFFLFTFFWLLLINRPNINNQEEKVFKSFQFSATSHTFQRTPEWRCFLISRQVFHIWQIIGNTCCDISRREVRRWFLRLVWSWFTI